MGVLRTARLRAFTLVELLVSLAIVGLLLSVAVPRYFKALQKSRETVLIENLHGIRASIQKFYSDQGRYPSTLTELVEERYFSAIPIDPITERDDTWVVVESDERHARGVRDVRSGAVGESLSGKPYEAL